MDKNETFATFDHMIFSWFANIFNVWSILKYAKNALAKYVFQVAKCKDLMFIANWFVFETRINGFNFLIMGLLRRGFKLLAMICAAPWKAHFEITTPTERNM